jgi:hypothetical protein
MKSTPKELGKLTPLLKQVIALVGRRADDPELVAFVTKTLGQKLPDSTTDVAGTKNIVVPKQGLEMAFSHDVKNEKYPLVPKTKKTFMPYLSLVWLTPKFVESLPFGVKFGMAPNEVTKLLGVEPVRRPFGLLWARVLDADREVVLKVDAKECRIGVDEARELSGRHGVPSKAVTGLFVAWAVRRNLIDASRVGTHGALLAEVRTGTRRGSELLTAAWPRGLWDVHLVDKPGLRDFAFGWFHNIDVGYIRDDLVSVFGGREGPHGHEEPVLDDDTPEAVEKATPKLDERFAEWV